MSGMLSRFKKAKEFAYSDDSDVVQRGEKTRYVNHEGDFVLRVLKVRAGISENKQTSRYKKPYILVVCSVEKIHWQSDVEPQTDVAAAKGEEPLRAPPVHEGENVGIYLRLPRGADPETMTIAEQYQIVDVCNLFGAILGIEGNAVDLEQVDGLLEDDGKALVDFVFGCRYDKSVVQVKDHKGTPTGEENVYINERPYYVDAETFERAQPLTAEEYAELMAE